MIGQAPENARKLRVIAARFRAHSAETGVQFYRRKFEGVALELEQAALDAESRAWMDPGLKRAS